jgi:hypothetical protein
MNLRAGTTYSLVTSHKVRYFAPPFGQKAMQTSLPRHVPKKCADPTRLSQWSGRLSRCVDTKIGTLNDNFVNTAGYLNDTVGIEGTIRGLKIASFPRRARRSYQLALGGSI